MKSGIKKIAMWLVLLIIFIMVISAISGNANKKMSYSELLKNIENNQVESIKISDDNKTASIKIKDDAIEKTVTIPSLDTFMYRISDKLIEDSDNTIELSQTQESKFLSILEAFAPTILLMIFIFFIWVMFMNPNSQGGNKTMSFGKSKARMMTPADKNKITFEDVAGIEEEKQELEEIVEFLKNPKKFTDMGARIPKGVLLVGHPGTGKTLLAKAVAGEAKVPFFYISGSDFVELFVGVGASRVRDMFKQAKQTAPCLIFIDEIDAVGRERGTGLGGGHDEREQTLNQLLSEMDGFGENEGIIIIAATNRPDVLDPALLRPGRFDRQVTVNRPDVKEREEILKVHAKNKVLANNVNLKFIAERTPGYSGADLENLLNEAALLAVRRNKEAITMDEIDEASDRVLMGPAKTSRKVTEYEKKIVAYHEAGHAVSGIILPNGEEVHKITIIPRGMAGGYTQMLPKEERTLVYTKNELEEQIITLLSGRASEEYYLDEVSTGASDDLKRATKIARSMVTEYGMSSLGPMQFEHRSESVFLGRDYNQTKNFSDQVALLIDQEVKKIIDDCYKEAKKIISKEKKLIEVLANELITKETLTKEEIERLVEENSDYKVDHSEDKKEESKKTKKAVKEEVEETEE